MVPFLRSEAVDLSPYATHPISSRLLFEQFNPAKSLRVVVEKTPSTCDLQCTQLAEALSINHLLHMTGTVFCFYNRQDLNLLPMD
jgi:hypothetical protein